MMRMFTALVVVAACGAVVSALPQQPRNPVIGIVTMPSLGANCVTAWEGNVDETVRSAVPKESVNATSCLWSVYPKWLQESGIRVVPFPWDAPQDEQDALYDKVNGLLFTGGMLGPLHPVPFHAFFRFVQKIYNKTVARNRDGDAFVLWGTCQGFELLQAAAAGSLDVIKEIYYGVAPAMLAVNFTAHQPTSRMFGAAPASVLWELSSQPTALNWHYSGVSPHDFRTTNIRTALRMLATNEDTHGQPFVSAFEGIDTSIYGTQWHPERVSYQFNIPIPGTKTAASIHCSQYLSMFLRDQLQKNNHSFATPEEAEKASIANYNPVNMGFGVEIYYFHR